MDRLLNKKPPGHLDRQAAFLTMFPIILMRGRLVCYGRSNWLAIRIPSPTGDRHMGGVLDEETIKVTTRSGTKFCGISSDVGLVWRELGGDGEGQMTTTTAVTQQEVQTDGSGLATQ
ncbi:hypothetical protein Bbelb_059390 [Branchiostoma belcheri]|nr:hypothetical protein Bbelb_059390 [Branchiostoma belcheri]